MEQNDSEPKPAPVPNANQENRPRRASIELTKVDVIAPKDPPEGNPTGKKFRPEVFYKGEADSGSWMFCLKCTLIFVNTIIWVLGAIITGVAIWMAVDPSFWNLQLNLEMKMFSTAVYVGIAVGALILIIGLTGCIGAWKESACTILLFFIIILILVIMEGVAMGIVWSASKNNSELQEHLVRYLESGYNKRAEDDSLRYFIDLLQTKLQCCGVKGMDEEFEKGGPDDSNGLLHPMSCIDEATGFPYTQGCLEATIKFLKDKAGIFGGILSATFVLQLAALSLSVCLFCGLRQAKKNIF